MEKFRTDSYGNLITKYEVVKETEKQITYLQKYTSWPAKKEESREVRESKSGRGHNWHDTFEEAKNYLIENIKKEILYLENRANETKEKLLKIESLQP